MAAAPAAAGKKAPADGAGAVRHADRRTIDSKRIRTDPNNPNRMTPAQMEALHKTIDKYGYAADVWVRPVQQGKKYEIIDGQHRYEVLVQKGETQIPCRVFNVDDTGARILRQIANKLKGTHDPALDISEYDAIRAAGLADEFAAHLGQSANEMEYDIDEMMRLRDEASSPLLPEEIAPPAAPGAPPATGADGPRMEQRSQIAGVVVRDMQESPPASPAAPHPVKCPACGHVFDSTAAADA